jgi:hypothetical protein
VITKIESWIGDNKLIELKRVINSTFIAERNLTKEFEDMAKRAYWRKTCGGAYICIRGGIR